MKRLVSALLITTAASLAHRQAGTLQPRQQGVGAASTSFPSHEVDSSLVSGSPDGRLSIRRRGRAADPFGLVSEPSGSEQSLPLAEGSTSFVWEPGSRRVAFETPDAGISVLDIATRSVQSIDTKGTPLSWTTAGRILVRRIVGFGLGRAWYLVAAAGGDERMIPAFYRRGDVIESVLPLGTTAVIRRADRLVLRTLATSSEETITSSLGSERLVAVSPDGKLVAFAADRNGVRILAVAGLDQLPAQNAVTLMPLAFLPESCNGWWTTDGSLIAIMSNGRGQPQVVARAFQGVTYDAVKRLLVR